MSLQGREGRIAKIGRLLLWEGRVGRARLISEFDLSDTRASEWLREFREANPRWSRWQSKTRQHVATPIFYQDIERLVRGDHTPMLEALMASYVRPGAAQHTVVPWDLQAPNPLTFSRLNIAISDARQVQFTYTSMAHPDPHSRTIEPHSLVLAGRRWHVRGYCLETREFRDFVLGRMRDACVLGAARTIDPAVDLAWNTIVNVRIHAHPALTPQQQIVVRGEMFRGAVARVESCRGALVQYMLQELRVAIDPAAQLPPEYQLAVENPKECRPWLFQN